MRVLRLRLDLSYRVLILSGRPWAGLGPGVGSALRDAVNDQGLEDYGPVLLGG